MRTWAKKARDNEGFTLAELLIVVAIIAVLVAVSIPIFTAKLEKSRESTDLSNLRSAKGAAVTAYLAGDELGGKKFGSEVITAYYDAENGVLVAAKPATGYGKGTTTVGDSSNTANGYDPAVSYTDQTIKVVVDKTGKVTLSWE